MGSDVGGGGGTAALWEISIHAPRMGSDSVNSCFIMLSPSISIHAPRMGSDRQTVIREPSSSYFNPRSPHGERLKKAVALDILAKFQSTLPAWGATSMPSVLVMRSKNFNPRSPHGERLYRDVGIRKDMEFQSTLPAWGATAFLDLYQDTDRLFQSTLPAWGATGAVCDWRRLMVFQSTLPAWGATVQSKHTAMTA